MRNGPEFRRRISVRAHTTDNGGAYEARGRGSRFEGDGARQCPGFVASITRLLRDYWGISWGLEDVRPLVSNGFCSEGQSWVLHGVEVVGRSNPLTPTKLFNRLPPCGKSILRENLDMCLRFLLFARCDVIPVLAAD